jgi:hypothetical protein
MLLVIFVGLAAVLTLVQLIRMFKLAVIYYRLPTKRSAPVNE